jgi:hypothetical protein
MPSQQGRETIVNQPPQPPYQGQPQPPFEGPPPPGQPPQQWQQPPPQQQWPQQPQPQWDPQQQWPQQPQPQWEPQQQWPQQPQQAPTPPLIPGPGLGTHLKRAIDWNVAEVVVTPREHQALVAAGIEDRLQGLFAWRRSSLLIALPLLVLSVILSFVQAGQTDTEGETGLGMFLNWLPSIGLLFIPIGAMRAIAGWTELRSTSRFLIACWLVSIVLPLITALVPLDYIYDLDAARAQAADPDALSAQILLVRILAAVQFALVLLPVVLSVPGGVLKGAARVKSLFPSAALPGWFLVAVAPFYSLFTIVVFVLIDQIVGNGLLMVGVAILAFIPWLFVIYRNVYARPLSILEAKTELARASRAGGWLMGVAILCIVIFMLTAKVEQFKVLGSNNNDAVFSYVDVGRTLVEVLSRSIVTTVVFCTVFLQMIYADWMAMHGLRGDIRREHDTEMMALERYIRRGGPVDPTMAVPQP